MQGKIRHSGPIGRAFKDSNFSWIRYWTTHLFGQDNLNLWIKSRNGLELADSLGGTNPAITLPYLYKPTGNEYAYVTDNKALDVANNLGVNPATPAGDTGFTLCGWVKAETTNKSAARYLMGKPGTNAVSGIYKIVSNVTTGYLYCTLKTSTGSTNIISTTDFTANGQPWFFLRMVVNSTTSKIHFYINEVEYESGTSYTGTISTLDNAYDFCIGTGNGNAGSGVQKTALSSHSDTYVYPFILTPEQGATLMARGHVAGAVFHTDGVLREDNVLLDLSGNNRHMTGVNLTIALKKLYSAYGSRHCLDKGYTNYKQTNAVDKNIPYTDSGIPLSYTPGSALFKLASPNISEFAGDTSYHNLADSYITFSGDEWDRSNATIWSDDARSTYSYYSASVPKRWHISEIKNNLFYSWLNTAYQQRYFSKYNSNAFAGYQTLKEIMCYDSTPASADLSKILQYCADNGMQTWNYFFTDQHYCATRGDKILAFNDTTKILSLSLDGGDTFAITKDVSSDIDYVVFAHFWANGNITIVGHRKIFISTDNLATYSQVDVKDRAGNDFDPDYDSAFANLGYQYIELNGVEHLTWGCGSVVAEVQFTNKINIWHSANNGVSFKSVFQLGTDLPAAAFKHFHGVNFNPTDGSFWATTGDGDDSAVECHFIKGTYNAANEPDPFTWELIASGDTTSLFMISGIVFYQGFAYVSYAGTTAAKKAVYRVAYASMADQTKYERLFENNAREIVHFHDGGSGEMICKPIGTRQFLTTKNGLDFVLKTVTGGPDFTGEYNGYVLWQPPNNDRYYLCGIWLDSETQQDYAKGINLMVKF